MRSIDRLRRPFAVGGGQARENKFASRPAVHGLGRGKFIHFIRLHKSSFGEASWASISLGKSYGSGRGFQAQARPPGGLRRPELSQQSFSPSQIIAHSETVSEQNAPARQPRAGYTLGSLWAREAPYVLMMIDKYNLHRGKSEAALARSAEWRCIC